MIRAIGERVVIRPVERETMSPGGLYLPNAGEKRPDQGVVVSVGGKVEDVKSGDFVLFSKYGADEIKYAGETLFVVKADNVYAVVD